MWYTWPVYCTAIGGILMLLWDIVIFRLVAYLLNMICLIIRILYKILTQFYTNFSRQEHQIDVLYVSFNFWDSQVSAYTPLSFFLYSDWPVRAPPAHWCIFVNLKNQKLKIEIYSINIKSFLTERINISFQNFIEPILNSLVYRQGYQQR